MIKQIENLIINPKKFNAELRQIHNNASKRLNWASSGKHVSDLIKSPAENSIVPALEIVTPDRNCGITEYGQNLLTSFGEVKA